jgi:hypothetical protein
LLVMDVEQFRALALALPGTTEHDHHGRPSFRVSGRIFATVWTDQTVNVMAGAGRIEAAVAGEPDICRSVFWGKRLAAVGVDLSRADPLLVEDLLDHAWRAKASAQLQRTFG